jgi:hypothetical protein
MNKIIDLTVILTAYNRPENIEKQLQFIKKQTYLPKEIWVWTNKGDKGKPKISDENVKIIDCSFNFKFHGRFALGLLAKTKYISIFDDDCFPQSKWFENCFNNIEKVNGIYGASGVYLEGNAYQPNKKYGWNGINNDNITEVDLVGHSWFFKKESLKYLWMEEPITWDNGEDIQFSYLAKKYGKINTYVPPHPKNNLELWGNIEKLGRFYGDDDNATYKKSKNHYNLRNQICDTYIKNGWKLARIK